MKIIKIVCDNTPVNGTENDNELVCEITFQASYTQIMSVLEDIKWKIDDENKKKNQ